MHYKIEYVLSTSYYLFLTANSEGVSRMLLSLLIFPFLLSLTEECPCTFNDGTVSCDPGTQSSLPWILPDCLTEIENDEVKSRKF